MAKEYSGGIILSTGFRLDNPSPIDDRLVVENTSDLTSSTSLPNIYGGIIIAVINENYRLYKWNGSDRTDINNWVPIEEDTTENSLSTTGRSSITGSLVISGSSTTSGNLTVSDTIFTDVISASAFSITGDGQNPLLLITSGSTTPISINQDGLILFDNFTYTPPPVEGGFLYSGSNFFIGLVDP